MPHPLPEDSHCLAVSGFILVYSFIACVCEKYVKDIRLYFLWRKACICGNKCTRRNGSKSKEAFNFSY